VNCWCRQGGESNWCEGRPGSGDWHTASGMDRLARLDNCFSECSPHCLAECLVVHWRRRRGARAHSNTFSHINSRFAMWLSPALWLQLHPVALRGGCTCNARWREECQHPGILFCALLRGYMPAIVARAEDRWLRSRVGSTSLQIFEQGGGLLHTISRSLAWMCTSNRQCN
jgi:hypothetical protein